MSFNPIGSLGQPNASLIAKPADTTEADNQRDKLKKATQGFEAVFIGTMLKQVRKSMSGSNPLFGGSQEAKQYQEMADEGMAEQMSKTGSFGLAKILYKSVAHSLGLDEDEQPTATPITAPIIASPGKEK